MAAQVLGFIKVVPTVSVEDGLVYITGPRGELVCTADVFQEFIFAGLRLLRRQGRAAPKPLAKHKKRSE